MVIFCLLAERTEIKVKPENVFITEGKPFDLRCEATKDDSLELNYRWLKDNAPLQYSSRVVWKEGVNTLTVSSARTEDTGVYTCVAYTPHPRMSEDRQSALVSIKGKLEIRISQMFPLPGDQRDYSE